MTTDHIEYHVVKNVDMWLRLKVDNTEVIHLKIGGYPELVFDVKTLNKNGKTTQFILQDVFVLLRNLHDFILKNKIFYQPTGIIGFVFNSVTSVEILSNRATNYRIPASKEIAAAVVSYRFNREDRLASTFDDDLIIYYYLSLLVYIDHPVFNDTLRKYLSGSDDRGFLILSTDTSVNTTNATAEMKSCTDFVTQTKRADDISIVQLYTDIVYFLYLVMEPEEPSILETQMARIFLNLCDKIGVKPFVGKIGKPFVGFIRRGRAWKPIHNFFKSRPEFRNELIEAVIHPTSIYTNMKIGEWALLSQVREVWQWYKLHDFFECYTFAMSPDTKAHHGSIEIIKETDTVIDLYAQLLKEEGERAAYAGFFEDEEFLRNFDTKRYPTLLYAVRRKSRNQSEIHRKNWLRFKASLPRTSTEKLDFMLDFPTPSANDQPTGEYVIIKPRVTSSL